MNEPNVPTAVEIVQIHVPAVQILEGHRIQTTISQANVFPTCIGMFAVVILLYIILTVLKFIK